MLLIPKSSFKLPNFFSQSRGLSSNVERKLKSDPSCAVAAAAAHDWNDELTVILSSIETLLDAHGPSPDTRVALLEVRAAAQRCAWKASGLLNFTARQGARPSATPMERLIS
jgi:hypothetical protein